MNIWFLFIVDSKGFEGLIETLQKRGVLPEPYRENDGGWMLYPVLIARDILKEVEELS